MSATQQQMYEAQQRLADAQRLQRQQEEAQRAPAAAIAQAQQELAQLAQQQRHERFNEQSAANSAACQYVRDLNTQVITALSRAQIDEALRLRPLAQGAWKAHTRAWRSAIDAVAVELEAAVSAATDGQTSLRLMDFSTGQAVYPYESQLEQTMSIGYALIGWIAQTPLPAARQVRKGLVFALEGQLYDPTPGYDAHQSFVSDARMGQWYWTA